MFTWKISFVLTGKIRLIKEAVNASVYLLGYLLEI